MEVLHFIHISDTHVGPTLDADVRGALSSERTSRLVAGINRLPFDLQAVVHTGDIVNDPDPEAYRLAAELMRPLRAPLLTVVGNHDDADMIRDAFAGIGKPLGKDPQRHAYSMDLAGHRLFVLDAKVSDPQDPSGFLPEDQLAGLLEEVENTGDPFSVWLHYPPLDLYASWMNEYLLLRNGEDLHEALVPYAGRGGRLSGVFFGHIHRSMQIYRDGVLYSAVSSPACEFTAYPGPERIEFLSDCDPFFHHISFGPQGTVVKGYPVRDSSLQ